MILQNWSLSYLLLRTSQNDIPDPENEELKFEKIDPSGVSRSEVDSLSLFAVRREDLRNVCSLARAALVKVKYMEATMKGVESLSISRASRSSNDKRVKNSVFLLVKRNESLEMILSLSLSLSLGYSLCVTVCNT